MSIGIWQIALVLLLVLILFGAGKLPRVMGDVAKGIKTFKSGMREDENEEKDEPKVISPSEDAKMETPKADAKGEKKEGASHG